MPPSVPSPISELAGGKLLIDRPATDVVRLTIDNPTKRNALDHPILDAITATLGKLAGEPEVGCVIVTGTGGIFSAGYEIGGIADGKLQEAERLVAHPFSEALEALESFPRPTLAALPGHAIGGGLELAVACDLRVAAAGIKLGMPPAKLGLVYSHTGLRRFVDAIGAPRTRELFLLGSYIDADTALAWGLVNRVTDGSEARGRIAAAGRRARRQRAALPDRQQARDRDVAGRAGRAPQGRRRRADRAAPRVVCLARPARGHKRVRREAGSALDRRVDPGRQAAAGSLQTRSASGSKHAALRLAPARRRACAQATAR